MFTAEEEERYGKGNKVIKGDQLTVIFKPFDELLLNPLQFSTKNTISLANDRKCIEFFNKKQQTSPFVFGPIQNIKTRPTSIEIRPPEQQFSLPTKRTDMPQDGLIKNKFNQLVAHFDLLAHQYDNSNYQFPIHEPTFFPDE